MAARSLNSSDLSDLAIQLYICLAAVLLQRTSIISPAMVTQRLSGPSRVPLRWIIVSASTLSCTGLVVSAALGHLIGIRRMESAVLVAAVILFLCLQDGLRYWAITSANTSVALSGDFVWLVVLFVLYIFAGGRSWGVANFLHVTLACAAISALFIGIGGSRRGEHAARQASFSATWHLGRWGTLTSLSSTIAVLAPLVGANGVVSPAAAGLYRTLQTVLGPLGVLATSVSTSMLSTAWNYSDAAGVRRLQRSVRRYSLGLLIFSSAYLGVGVVVIILITGIKLGTLWYVPAVVVIGGMLGAPVTPLSTGSLVLGHQRTAAIIAMTTFSFSIVVTTVASTRPLAGHIDPVAVVTVGVGVIGLVWWTMVFRGAARLELMHTVGADHATAKQIAPPPPVRLRTRE